MNKKEALELFKDYLEIECPNEDCKKPVNELCDTAGVWVHAQRISARLESENMKVVDAMTHEELAQLWRFAPSSHPLIQPPYGERVKDRLQAFGGITPEISKRIGL